MMLMLDKLQRTQGMREPTPVHTLHDTRPICSTDSAAIISAGLMHVCGLQGGDRVVTVW